MITAEDVRHAFEEKLLQLERTEKAKTALGAAMPVTVAPPLERTKRTSVLDIRGAKGRGR